MRQLLLAVSLVSLATACATTHPQAADPSALKGVHTVYVNSRDAFMLEPALREVPGLRIVTDPHDADVVMTISVSARSGFPAVYRDMTYETGPNAAGSNDTHTVPVRIGEPTTPSQPTAVAVAVNRTTQKSVVIYEGFSEYLGAHLATNFVKAWRAANT
jgi:hypothetical protein